MTGSHCHRPVCQALDCRLLLAAGNYDGTFDLDGRMTLSFPGGGINIVDTALQADGKVIVAGNRGNNMAVARLNVDGSIDTTFGSGGLFESTRRPAVFSVAVHTDAAHAGKIVLGLGGQEDANNVEYPDLTIGRLLANGSGFDPAFGDNGIAHVGDRWRDSFINDVAVQRDGKVIGAGYIDNGTLFARRDFALVRFNADGMPDNSFGGGDAVSEHGFGDDFEGIEAITIDYNGDAFTNPRYGTVVAVGHTGSKTAFLLLRVRPDGMPDTSFDGDGKFISPDLSTAGKEDARGVAVQADGRIVVAGIAGTADPNVSNFLVSRYTSGGGLDPSFGTNGVVELDLGGRDEAHAVVLGYHGVFGVGNLLVSGGSGSSIAIVALTPNGQLDSRFSGDGILQTTVPVGSGMFQTRSSGLVATQNLYAPARRLIIAGGNGVGRVIDVGSSISIGGFNPQMFEQGQQGTSFIVARSVALPVPETIFLGTSGTATLRGATRDLDGTNITFGNGVTTQTQVVIPANSTFVNVILTPIDDTLPEPDETAIFTVGNTALYDAAVQPTASHATIIRDNDTTGGPVVTSSTFEYQNLPHRVRFTFSQNVQGSIAANDFQTASTFGSVPFSFSYDPVLNTATLTFSGVLPDADYTIRVIAGGITNSSGQPMPNDHFLFTFFLMGDANRDRRVDIADFAILASNFNRPGNFSQGDFNYNGTVEIGDFAILASRFNTTVPTARMAPVLDLGSGRDLAVRAAPAGPMRPGTFSASRAIGEVLAEVDRTF